MVFAACHIGGQAADPDAAGDGTGTGSDGSNPGLGMFVTWRADPALPGTVTDKIAVTSATFQIDRLEVVGDAGVDARTTRSKYLLSWDSSGKPSQESFAQAPVGVYSKINLVMAVGNLSEDLYEIRGTWTDTGALPRSFRIRDRGLSLSAAVDCDKTLPAAGTATITLKLDLRNALNGINFKMLEDEEGGLELRDGAQLLAFRMRLRDAFALGQDD